MAQAGKNTLESHQIATLANGAISSIQDLISSLASDEARCSKATSQFARFKLWAGSLGAHRESGHRSLDYRLRDASFIRDHVIKLLEQLGEAIEDASSISSHNVAPVHEVHDSLEPELIEYLVDDDGSLQSDLDLALANVSHVVDCLLRLSVTIRNPAPHDQFMSRAGAETMVAYEAYDIRHVLEKFPRIESELQERLGRAVTNRRRFFKYREDHYARIASGIDHDDGLNKGSDQTTVVSSVPSNLKDAAKERPAIDLDIESVVSRTSYASSLNNPEELRVPPVPKESLLGPFMCPFCYLMIEVNSINEWKKHVFRDLQPYICLAKLCLTQDHKFSSRSDWSRHMEQMHWRIWRCPLECQQVSHSADEFRCHLQKSHPNDLTAPQQDTFERICGEKDLEKAYGPCPLCAEVQIITSTQYYKHIGYHLEQLSLFSLPHIMNGNDENRSQKDSMEESDQELDVVGKATERQGSQEGHIDSAMERLNIDDSLGSPLKSNLDNEEDAKDKVFGGSGDGDVADSYRTPLEEAPNKSNWRWNCCNCTGVSMSYNYDASCLSCGHSRDPGCHVWALSHDED